MKVAESIAVILILLGVILILSGISQGASDTMTEMINGQAVQLDNKYGYNLNMREFIGIICLIGALIASIAGGGATTVRDGRLRARRSLKKYFFRPVYTWTGFFMNF